MAKGGGVGSFQDEMPAAVKCELIDEDLENSSTEFFERDLASYWRVDEERFRSTSS
jgi:hypothetical protein